MRPALVHLSWAAQQDRAHASHIPCDDPCRFSRNMKDELVKVFRFEYFDRETRSFKVSGDWALPGAVESMGAVLLPETVREVPAGEISFSGLWKPPDST